MRFTVFQSGRGSSKREKRARSLEVASGILGIFISLEQTAAATTTTAAAAAAAAVTATATTATAAAAALTYWLPDRMFWNLRASKYVDLRILCTLETMLCGLCGSKIAKCSVGSVGSNSSSYRLVV